MINTFLEYYRCPDGYVKSSQVGVRSEKTGYFRCGGTICYGRHPQSRQNVFPAASLHDAYPEISLEDGKVFLPFDMDEVCGNLRYEFYTRQREQEPRLESAVNRTYYFVRPLLPVRVRRHLQKLHLNGWDDVPFPHWPVDRSVDKLQEQLLLLSLRAQKAERIPFIWFWPNGAPSAAIVTHDVETEKGKKFCRELMDIDDSFGIKTSFQVVPESRYSVTPDFLDSIINRGFELGVQDLNHDGHLFRNKKKFISRAAKINSYGREWGAKGFRAAILYRRQEWFQELDFSYDMSVPNVGHLDPQRGGCCTVMPYFVGKLLELPVTTTQDYSLLHILKRHSIDLWKRQIELIMENYGLLSFIIHPDYITDTREQNTYKQLLEYLVRLRAEKGIWISTPQNVNEWWRQRARLNLIQQGNSWRIEGSGNERACIAYATEKNNRLQFTIEPAMTESSIAKSAN